MERIKSFLKWLRSCITPGYVSMLVAAFILWYMTKLGETYTTDYEFVVVMDDEEFSVECSIRGKGTNLIGYTIGRKQVKVEVPASEITFDSVTTDEGDTYRYASPTSVQRAITSRISDIEIVDIGNISPVEVM